MSRFLKRHAAGLRLAAGAVITTVVWCVLLPWFLTFGPVERHVSLMEARGVNPAAMYYTELEQLPLRPVWLDEVVVLWP